MGVSVGRTLNRLSAKGVQNLKRPGYHPDGGGLYLQISPAGTKSWIFRYTLTGRSREMGLGSAAAFTLEEARQRAQDARKLLADRIDPIAARNAQRAQEALDNARSISFRECWTQYIASHRAGWKNAKHADQWTNTLEAYCGPIAGALPVADVDTAIVLKVLEPIWTKIPETARRLRARMENVLDWATVRTFRTGDNPARWRGHLQKLLPALQKKTRVRHHPALPYDQAAAFIAELRQQQGTASRALEFLILTAARTNEVIGARPGEFDLAKAVWTIPAERMKAGREHRVPLSPRAVEIIKAQPKGDYVFPLSNMAMLELLKRMDRTSITVHGFRSTFRDWAAETTGYPREVCEMALAHTIGNATEAAYRRGDLFDKRRRLMDEWAKFCNQIPRGGTVTPIRKRA